MSGNEIYCLSLKGISPGELTVGNSVRSVGLAGGLGAAGRTFAGGEVRQITDLISEGRHAAITRMEQEAQKHGATGVTGVSSELRTMAGYTEFLSQGTAVHAQNAQHFFSTAASGIELYCHLDAGYTPMKFVMGNVAYALGIGRGLLGGLRTLARGEVKEYSSMYNEIRHTALHRLRSEAAQMGANAVVDVKIEMLPYGPGTVELLMTGTASHHPALSQGAVQPDQVATSELSGEELWNLAFLGYQPVQLVMATSVYSLGVAGGIGAMFKALSKGELTDVTQLVYEARENCLALLRAEATRFGAERVIGSKLNIRELQSGMIEVVAVGTAVRPQATSMKPHSPQLIPQAVIVDKSSFQQKAQRAAGMEVAPGINSAAGFGLSQQFGAQGMAAGGRQRALGCIIAFLVFGVIFGLTCLSALLQQAGN
jgi:uncharacterized protein YbjQ (UPF0145 family)